MRAIRINLALVMAASAFTGCAAQGTPERPEPRTDELGAHFGSPCPARLPHDPANRHGFEPSRSADESPSLEAPDRAWVCKYDSFDVGSEPSGRTTIGWIRVGEHSEVPVSQSDAIESELSRLAPPAADERLCTADLGPRWMLVLSNDGDLTGVVVDAFGCGDVRLTDEPFTTVPGEATAGGTVPGVLAGSSGLLAILKAVADPMSSPAAVLGPTGFLTLRLGGQLDEPTAKDPALATAAPGSRHDGWPPGCSVLQYVEDLGTTPQDTLDGTLSDLHGLEQLFATERMVTPDGIRIGSPLEDVKNAFDRPRLEPGDLLVVPASNDTVYRIQLDETVVSIALELNDLTCVR